MKAYRRSILRQFVTSLAGVVGLNASVPAIAESVTKIGNVPADAVAETTVTQPDVPLYSGVTRQGNLLFVQGVGAHFDGNAQAHADHILKEMEKMLVKAGSSMQKVLKVTVYLHDINDYKAMNEVYKGRFGAKPPVRTTVSPRAGIPNGSLVEMDCIAYV